MLVVDESIAKSFVHWVSLENLEVKIAVQNTALDQNPAMLK